MFYHPRQISLFEIFEIDNNGLYNLDKSLVFKYLKLNHQQDHSQQFTNYF